MAIAETERLVSALKRLEITCEHIAINMLIPLTKCGFCARKRQRQEKYVQEARTKFSGYMVSEMPLFPHEIEGIDSLAELSEVMYARKAAKGVGVLESVLQSARLS